MLGASSSSAKNKRLSVAAVLVGTTVVLIIVLLVATKQEPESRNFNNGPDKVIEGLPEQHETSGLDFQSQAVIEAFVVRSVDRENNGPQTALVPEDWEQPLFDILMDEEQSMDERNARLLELATGAARNVPAVQEECLMHLLFGIPDSNASQFLAVTTNPAIPVQMRAEFLKEALAMRPTELGEWLSQQVTNHYEPQISSVARLYRLEAQNTEE